MIGKIFSLGSWTNEYEEVHDVKMGRNCGKPQDKNLCLNSKELLEREWIMFMEGWILAIVSLVS